MSASVIFSDNNPKKSERSNESVTRTEVYQPPKKYNSKFANFYTPITINGEKKAICLVCEKSKVTKIISRKGNNTSGMKKHLQSAHSKAYEEIYGNLTSLQKPAPSAQKQLTDMFSEQHFRRRDHSMAKEYVHWEYHKKQEHNYWVNRDVVWKRVTYYEPGIDERITMYVEDSDNRVTQILDEDYTSDQNESNDDTFQFKRNFDRDSRRSYRKHRRQCADGSDNDSRRSFREGSEILYNSKYHQSKHVNHKNLLHLHPPSRMDVNKSVSNDRSSPCQKPPEVNFIRSCYGLSNELELDTNQNINNIDDVNKNDLASEHVSEVTEYASEVLETITPSSFKPESTKEKSMPLIPDFVNELSYSPEVESEIGTASNTECKRTMENLEAVRAADKSTTKLNLDLSNRKRHNSVSNCENVKPKKKSKHRDRDTLKSCNKTISTAQIKELRVVLQRLDSTMLDGIRVSTGQCDASEFKTHHSDQASWTNGHSSVSNKHMSDVSKKGTNIKLNDRVPVLPHSSVDVVSDQFASKKSHCHKQDNYNLKKSELKPNVRRTDNDEKRHLTKHVNGGQREVKSHHKNKGSDKKRHHSTKHVARDHTKEIRRFCLMVGPKYAKKCQQYGFACTKSIQTEHRSVWQKLKAYIRESINSNKSPDEIEGGIDKQLEEVVKAKKELVVVPNVKKQHEINFLRKITAGKVSKGSVTIRPYKSVTANCISLTKMTDLPCHEQFYSLLDQVDYTKEVDTFASLIPFPNQTVPEPDSADVVITAVGQPIVYERSASSFSDASTLVLNAEDDNQLVIDEGEPVANVEENLQSTSRDLNDISSEQNIQQTTSNLGDPVLGNVQTTFPGTNDVISDVNKQQTFLGLKAAPSDVPIQQTPLGLKDAPNDVNIEQTPLDLKDAPNYVNIQQTSLGWKDALSDVPIQQTPLDLKDAPNYVNIQQTSLGLKDASSDVPIQQIPLDMMDAPNDVNIQHTSLGLKDAPSDVTMQPITTCSNNLNETAHQIPLGLSVNTQQPSQGLKDATSDVTTQPITSCLNNLNETAHQIPLGLSVNTQQPSLGLKDATSDVTTQPITSCLNNLNETAHQIPLGLRDVSSKVNVQEISPDLNDAPGLVSIQQITSELYDLLNRKVQESSLELIASDVNMQQTTQNLNDVLDELTTPHISPDTNNVRDAVNAPKSSSNQAPNAALLLEELFGAATDIEKSSFHSQQSFMIVPASTIVEVTHKSNSGLTEIRKDTESTQVDTNAVALTSDVDKYFVGRYYVEWTCLFRFEHHESDTTCTLVKCTTRLVSVFHEYLVHEALFNRNLFPNSHPLPEGISTTPWRYQLNLQKYAETFLMITRKFSIDDNPDAFLEMVLGLKTENMCVYAFCLLRLIQSMPAINTWIRKILDRLAILYYINAKAYTAVLDESLKRLSPTDANNFLSRLRLVNEQNLKMKVDATKQPIDMILRELLCGNRAIGNPEHLLRFEERTVLTCNEIISAWKTWSSTNPKIKIKTNVLAKSDPTKMVVKPANKSPIAQWQYRAPQKQKKQAGTRVNPDQNTPSSQSRQNPIQGLRTMRHSYQPAQNSQNYPRQYNSGVQQYMSSYTQSPGYSSGDYQCPVSINSSQQNANQWNSSMPLAANSLPPRTIVNQQIMPPVTGYTSRAPSHGGVVHYAGGHAQNRPSLPYMPMASIRPTQGYNRDDVYCHARQYPQIAPMPAPHFVPTYRQEADRSGTLTQATPHAKSLVLIQGLNVNPEPVGSVQRQHTPTTICAPRYIPKQIVYSSQSINRNNQPQMCAPQLTTVTTADPSPTTQPCMIRGLIASTYANSRQPNENVPLALPVPLTAAWYSNNSYQQRENMPLVQQVPLPTPTYIDNSYRQRDSVPSTQVESAQPVISLVAGTADKDVEPATSTTVNVSTPSSSETLTQSAEFYINRLASCIEQMSKQGITLPVDLQKKVASLKDRQPCEEPDFDSTHLGIIAKAFQAMVPVMENITNLSLNAVKPMKEAIEVIEIDDDDEVKVEVTETTVNIGDCQSQTLDEIQFPPNPYELTEPVGSELTESNDCDDIEYQCICGKKAHVRCRCNAAIYCSEECRLAQIEEHRPTCMLNLGGTSLYKLLGPR